MHHRRSTEPFKPLVRDVFTDERKYFPVTRRWYDECTLGSWLLYRARFDLPSLRKWESVYAALSDEKFYLLLDDLEKAVGIESVEIILRKHLT